MQNAGVKFLAGSDGPDPYVFPGFSLHDELELLVQSGFTPAQALEAATTNPAIFMKKQQTTEPSKKITPLISLFSMPTPCKTSATLVKSPQLLGQENTIPAKNWIKC